MKNKVRFVLIVSVAYLLLAGLGVWLLDGPGYSSDYLKEHEQEHKRYLQIKKNHLFQLHAARPHLNPLEGPMLAEAAFALEYRERPAFKAEQWRMLLYSLWFRVLNAVFIFLMIYYFGWSHILNFLDQQISDVRDREVHLREDLAASIDEAAAMRLSFETLPEKEAELQAAHEALLQEKLSGIEEHTENALKQMALNAEKRIAAEKKAASVAIRRELVTNAVHELEMRYRKAASLQGLEKDVEAFSKFMGFLS